MLQVNVRVARPSEYGKLGKLYVAWGYTAGIAPADVVFVAELDGATVGIVRRTRESSITMLRGMYVDPRHRQQGVGTALLSAFERALPQEDCYCIPFANLTAFYGRAGFATVDEQSAPGFLIERLATYREEGHDVLVMRRGRGNTPDSRDPGFTPTSGPASASG